MKMKTIIRGSAVVLSAALVAAAAGADQSAAPAAKEKEYKGKVVYVNSEEHTLTVRDLLERKTFDLGHDCVITRWDQTAGRMDDLRPGQKVAVTYQDVNGVLAAGRVEQEALRCAGVVKVIDPEGRRLVLHTWEHNKKFALTEDCKVALHDQENGSPAGIKPGDHVTVLYEALPGGDVARQITRPAATFTGSVVAIDLPHHLVSAKGTFGVRQFSLGRQCSIVMDGRMDAPLMDVRLGQRLTINYDEVNGVNVASRIGPAEAAREAGMAQANR